MAMCEAGKPLRDGALAGLVLLFGSMMVDYQSAYAAIQAENNGNLQRLGLAIRDRTTPDDVIVSVGFDWSSELAYYSQRRFFCVPDWDWATPERVRRALKSLVPYHVGAVVIQPPLHTLIARDEVMGLLRRQGFEPHHRRSKPRTELLLRTDVGTR